MFYGRTPRYHLNAWLVDDMFGIENGWRNFQAFRKGQGDDAKGG